MAKKKPAPKYAASKSTPSAPSRSTHARTAPARAKKLWLFGGGLVLAGGVAVAVLLLLRGPAPLCSARDLAAAPLPAPTKTGIFTSYGVRFTNQSSSACRVDKAYALRAVSSTGKHSLDAVLPSANQPSLIQPGESFGIPFSYRDTTSLDARSCRPFEADRIELSFDNRSKVRWPLSFSACQDTVSIYASSVIAIPQH